VLPNAEAARVEAGGIVSALALDLGRSGNVPEISLQVRDAFGPVVWAKLAFGVQRLN
jgi:hypothetical protein